jgi:hypothetical protein
MYAFQPSLSTLPWINFEKPYSQTMNSIRADATRKMFSILPYSRRDMRPDKDSVCLVYAGIDRTPRYSAAKLFSAFRAPRPGTTAVADGAANNGNGMHAPPRAHGPFRTRPCFLRDIYCLRAPIVCGPDRLTLFKYKEPGTAGLEHAEDSIFLTTAASH